jgi:diguanylate cyclase (GGDEF)-like protein
LNLVILFRRAELGVFSIFLGTGIGSRIARLFSPIVLALPFLREATRAHFISSDRMPPHYTTAILASLTAMLAVALLVYLAWRIHGMEMEIHDLSLRDELTGLYNRRGFYLLAQQSLRMAHRSDLPFSVLFIDLDDLKFTNDSLGHHEGSRFLVETGEILKATFRETDVIGRIGGDEFAVAGQFSQAAMGSAVERMKELSEQRNAEAGRQIPLSFSVGYITSNGGPDESLDDLLVKADYAMYEHKRSKKVPVM